MHEHCRICTERGMQACEEAEGAWCLELLQANPRVRVRGFESAGSRTLVRSPSTSGAPNPFWGARVPHLGECARENELEATWMIQSPSS